MKSIFKTSFWKFPPKGISSPVIFLPFMYDSFVKSIWNPGELKVLVVLYTLPSRAPVESHRIRPPTDVNEIFFHGHLWITSPPSSARRTSRIRLPSLVRSKQVWTCPDSIPAACWKAEPLLFWLSWSRDQTPAVNLVVAAAAAEATFFAPKWVDPPISYK